MAKLPLPSGRVLELNELSFGDHLDAQRAAVEAEDARAYTLHIYRVATGMTDDELRALKAADGIALDDALDRELKTGLPFEKPPSARSRPAR